MIANISQRGVKLFPKSQLPNSENFRFLGYTTDGQKYRCEVVKRGCVHEITGMKWSELIGWTNCVGGEE